MNRFVLFTDSGCDLTKALIAECGAELVNLGVEIGGQAIDPGAVEDLKKFYDGMRQNKDTKTYAANTEQFLDAFEPYLAAGEDILYIAFSSGLSSTCGSAILAANELSEKYPGRRVVVWDSKCASLGEGLMVYFAGEMKKEGAGIDEIVAALEEKRPHLCHRFTVDDLVYLKRGGRISSATALLGSLLSIKPTLHITDEGKIVSIGKARGRKNAIRALFEDMKELAVNPAEQTVFISHADCPEDAEALAEMIRTAFSPKRIEIGSIGPVIGSHSGPGTLALFFLGSRR